MDKETVQTIAIGEDLADFAASIDRLRFIIRYATAPHCSKESVAEHSYYVAAYVLKLARYYDFDVEKALILALLHDYAEAYISDVPHPIKKQNPALETALEEAESKVLTDHLSPEFAQMIAEFNNGTSPEGLVCQLADVMSVVSYAKYEMELGNSSYMKQVYEKTRPRYVELINKLEKYLSHPFESSSDFIKGQIDMIFNTRIENK